MNLNTKRKILFVVMFIGWIIIALAVCLVFADSARAQDRSQLSRALMSDYGWGGAAGGVAVHRSSIEYDPPYVGTWQRIPVGNVYGRWEYLFVVINCRAWSHAVVGVLDASGNYVPLDEMTGKAPSAIAPEPDTAPGKNITALCGLYGYVRTRGQLPPREPNIVNGVAVP